MPQNGLARAIVAALVLVTLALVALAVVLALLGDGEISAIAILLLGIVVGLLVWGLTLLTGNSPWRDIARGGQALSGRRDQGGRDERDP